MGRAGLGTSTSAGGKDPDYAAWSFATAENPLISPALIEAERTGLPEDVYRA